tara:strand:+ start:88 stop:885 length:798 start_codon:yes stop_codon:yes gene_type:complete
MSWGIFKSNMKRYMANPIGVATLQAFAKKLTTEYDLCMRRGIQGINLCTIQKGNKDIMETLVILALTKCFAIQKPPKPVPLSPILKELGPAVKAYWTGATMNPFPTPPIPAPGAIQNLLVTQNICINPGTWIAQFELPPVESQNFFINAFVLVAQIHLLTLKGMIYTTSLYPSAPSPIPGPGVISWSMYVIPGGRLGGSNDDSDDDDTIATSDWQTLAFAPPNSAPKKFSPNSVYNTGDVIESAGKFYLAQNPEKNGLRCWNIPF